MDNLRGYQQKAARVIYDFFNSNEKKAKIYLSTGLGRTAIIVSSIQLILQNRNVSVAILSPKRILCEQLQAAFTNSFVNNGVAMHLHEFKGQEILITTYQEVIKTKFDLGVVDIVICNDAQFLKTDSYISLLGGSRTKFLGILQNNESSKEWFSDAKCLFSYTVADALRDGYSGYFSERDFIQQFLILLLKKYGFNNILQEVKLGNKNSNSYRADIVAKKGTSDVVIEAKLYRNLYVSQTIISNALSQILNYKELVLQDRKREEFVFILVLPCEVDDKLQEEYFKKENIVIWDINNLLYMCYGDKELSNLLVKCMPYPLMDLKLQKPLYLKDIEREECDISSSVTESYFYRLQKCKPGKENQSDKEYGRICTDIIKFLFETEFYKVSEQHKTEDEMFRMDLLCSLKGTTEFWRFLISFYHTRFVVFEYKNYREPISQNLIYITEKYLFPVALRNVAFIISRKGFDLNAQKAALGCLRESGKLIISIDEEDLIKMVSLKEKGEEPSDYLLDKVEDLLMLVSK